MYTQSPHKSSPSSSRLFFIYTSHKRALNLVSLGSEGLNEAPVNASTGQTLVQALQSLQFSFIGDPVLNGASVSIVENLTLGP